MERWEQFLTEQGIPWPRQESSNRLDLTDDTFREMAQLYPCVQPFREVRHALSQLRLSDLAVGRDGRNRCLLSAFASRTGRNQPSNAKFIFGPAVWLRGLIKPELGRALAYIDYEQQEFGIAAALAGDRAMMEAYRSRDPYLAFAKQAKAVPQDATKVSHGTERDRFKICSLAVQYGMGEVGLAQKLGDPTARARELLRLHRETYSRYWEWSESVLDHALLCGRLQSTFGWQVHVAGGNVNPRSLRNFPLQANGAEMLRIACILATESGISVCAPVHDALLIEDGIPEIEETVARTQAAMHRAAEFVLDGFPLRTEANIIRYPDRYADKRGAWMWNQVMQLPGVSPVRGVGCHG